MTSTEDETTTLAKELIEAVATVLGSHPGHRVTHTKGTTLTGSFTATPRARTLTRAAHMQGDPVRVTVRFSNGDPNPLCPDAAQGDPRGMAVKFYLSDGSTTDIVCQSWPVFPTGTPEEFLAFIRAQGEGPEAFDAYLAANPKVAAAAAAIGAAGDPPRSWATMAFNSLVAYRLVNADGAGQFARWRLAPEPGEESLPEGERATADRDYLMTGILDLLPVRFRLLAQLAADEDQTVDSSSAWPEDREWVDMGVVEMTGPETERERDGDILVNDPTRVTDGIELSDDPILHIRTHLYGESVRRRSGVERPAYLR